MLYLCQQGQMFVTGENMHAGRDQQPLSYATRLPNEAQQDALRLLDSSRSVVNAALIKLWPKLDAFLRERDRWTDHARTGGAQASLCTDPAHPLPWLHSPQDGAPSSGQEPQEHQRGHRSPAKDA